MSETLRERIKAIADPLIEHGADHVYVRQVIHRELGIGIGGGGGGSDPDIPPCPYCGASGGGGHGGFCPEGR